MIRLPAIFASVLFVGAIGHGVRAEDGNILLKGAMDEAQRHFESAMANKNDFDKARPDLQRCAEALRESLKYSHSSAQFRMKGNIHMLLGELGPAVLHYRRALATDPDDRAAAIGLEYARSRVQAENLAFISAMIPQPHWTDIAASYVRRFGPWAIIISILVGWIAAARWVVTRRTKGLIASIACLALVVLVGTTWLVEVAHRTKRNQESYVVVSQPAVLRRGDGVHYLARREAPLPPGIEARVMQFRGAWIQVELFDGTTGWVPHESVLIDSPI